MSSYLSVVVGIDPSTTLRQSARAAELDNAIVHIHLDDGLDVSLIGSAADMTRLHTAIGEALALSAGGGERS